MKYRKEVDGLRSIAVLPVILFHAGFGMFSGGFVGVDVFFVISGYLITKILIDDLESGSFSIIRFYERRARRILPALFLVLAASLVMAWLWAIPAHMKDFAKSLLTSIFFSSNILFWRENGYFDTAADLKPLLHTWSLAVEEQFYLFFPLFLRLVWPLGRRRVFWIILALAAASLAASEAGWRLFPSGNFYLAPTRAWELLAGSILVLLPARKASAADDPLSLVGLALIIASVLAFDSSTPFPSLYALAPVLGTALVLHYGQSGTLTARILSLQPFVGIGLISYSAYLWHQPLFAFARLRSPVDPSPLAMAALVAASLVLAFLSWRYVEQPFRRTPRPLLAGRKKVFGASAAVAAAFSILCGAVLLTKGATFRFGEDLLKFVAAAEDRPPRTCHFGEKKGLPEFHPQPECVQRNAKGGIDVLVTGDSHAWALSGEVNARLREQGIGYYAISYSGCVPFPELRRLDKGEGEGCATFVTDLLEFARKEGIGTIVMTARYALYYRGDRYDNGEGGVEPGEPAVVDLAQEQGGAGSESREVRTLRGFEVGIRNLAGSFNIVLVTPIPEAGWNVPETLFRSALAGEPVEKLDTSLGRYRERAGDVNALFERLAAELPNVRVARSDAAMCAEETGRCINADAGGIYYVDDDHLSNAGARRVAPLVVEQIVKSLSTGSGDKPQQ